MHIYLGFVDHIIIEAYNECFLKYVHNGHSIVVYYPIDPRHFKELQYVLHHGPCQMVMWH